MTKILTAAIAAAFLAAGAAAHAQSGKTIKGVTEKAAGQQDAQAACEKLTSAEKKLQCLRNVGSASAGSSAAPKAAAKKAPAPKAKPRSRFGEAK